MNQNEAHPNKRNFVGSLFICDVPSESPPDGSYGHRILIPRAVAMKCLPTIVGMGVNINPMGLPIYDKGILINAESTLQHKNPAQEALIKICKQHNIPIEKAFKQAHFKDYKVGVITSTHIDSTGKAWISGYIWCKDFEHLMPDFEHELLRYEIGMSFESLRTEIEPLKPWEVSDPKKVMILRSTVFTGAAILTDPAFKCSSFQLI